MMGMLEEILIGLGYFVFLPLIWWAGNGLIKWVVTSSVKSVVPQPAALPQQDTSSVGALGEGEPSHEQKEADKKELKAGRIIGGLERLLILTGLLLGKWEVLVAVIALKTTARYKELDKQIRAEYFLIGSLCSILWAVVIAVLLLLYDRLVGFGLFPSGLLGQFGLPG
ncbi:hypothetical protein [Roseibium litorale]|uniref:MAPEG family protein n=1 Tax=Roseibium litorale TaxID=2803841 RepID=A0ABR9CLN6_9HYPH|nr:hypothetical protein [Roseibium litorale]MBD8891771.1 hypothetical protein [Roseibium litorale]